MKQTTRQEQRQAEQDGKQMFMNPHTGSTDTLDGWYPYTPENAELIPVKWDKTEKTWVEA